MPGDATVEVAAGGGGFVLGQGGLGRGQQHPGVVGRGVPGRGRDRPLGLRSVPPPQKVLGGCEPDRGGTPAIPEESVDFAVGKVGGVEVFAEHGSELGRDLRVGRGRVDRLAVPLLGLVRFPLRELQPSLVSH